MVRNYLKKKGPPKYSEEKLQRALDEIKAGTLTIHKASVLYGIPFATLYCRNKGTRGAIKKCKGRRTALPENVENVLATSVKTLAKWGFGLSRKEIIELVGQYVNVNKIETPFKRGIPGEDWFLNFKKRHNLSIRKPEPLEYARKKAATDPFIIYGYFDLLKKILTELNLEDKPKQIWNLDESSLSLDPSKSRIVGERGECSSRVISTSGRENTTFVLAANAAGGRAPPLIIFKAKNVWDQWKAPPDKEYPGTAYAATPNGWMETEVFKNYFEKVLIPALGNDRPVLVIYDGHSTHVSLNLVETALAKDITILKLPAHTSDQLQPLDVSVFKSFKQKWDQTVASWQRQNIGKKLPKALFSQFLGETWVSVSENVIMSGFRKSGIFPFNSDVIPRENFSKDALERWEMHLAGELARDNEASPDPHRSTFNNSSPSILNLPASEEEAIPTTPQSTIFSDQSSQNSVPVNPQSNETPVHNATPTISFEQIILSTIQQKQLPVNKEKKRKVASGAEVVTSARMLEVLKEKEKLIANNKAKINKKKAKINKKIGKKEIKVKKNAKDSESDTTDADSDNEVHYANSDESEWLEEEAEYLIESDDEDVMAGINKENEPGEDIGLDIHINQWVIVKYTLVKGHKYYVGFIQKQIDSRWEVKFARRKGAAFAWPIIEDIDTITADSIVKILPNPTITKRGIIYFDFKFRNMIIS
ncbi:uncharacterized protein LOC124635108 [Helicoverpa zea]|uniref:uncharacterized protein LOC124635108 n=1 Tax=Helicoverpa zea TaxID=7113 RepID=UPI001F584332|nr:uncharacterized protein LOC124635108 [Helicoverpa zea]